MTPEQYAQGQTLFLKARGLDPGERQAFLRRACSLDADLLAEIESLLQADEVASSIQPLNLPRGLALRADDESASDSARSHPLYIGQYRIRGVLGEGGMSIVYLAEQPRPRREVALKVMKLWAVSPNARRRLEFEAQILGNLRHPGIAQVFEAGTADLAGLTQPFFVMEFILGRPLTGFAKANGLDVSRRLELIAKVCDAVQHAHLNGVIHRDLKPANVLVGFDGLPKVLDFGVARATDSDIQRTTVQTDAEQVVGTIPYMSPEQISARRDGVDTRTDIYALGVMAFELLAKRLPYDVRGKTLAQTVRILDQEEPARLGSLDRSLRGDIETIVAKSITKDRAQRYSSAADLAEDIRRFLRREPIRARPTTTYYALRRFAQRNRALVGGGLLALLALAIGAAVSTTLYLKTESAQKTILRQAAEDRDKSAFSLNAIEHLLKRDREELRGTRDGGQQYRRRLESFSAWLNEFLEQPRDHGMLESTRALAMYMLGDVDEQLGAPARALKRHRAALEIRERLARENPDDPRYRVDLSVSNVRVGDQLKLLENLREAWDYYQRALGIDESLVSEYGDNRQYQDNLAWSYGRMGELAKRRGDLAIAERFFNRRCEVTARLASAEPGDLGVQKSLWESHLLLRGLAVARADFDIAAEHGRKGLAIAQRLAEARPAETDFQRMLACSYVDAANDASACGDRTRALEFARADLSIANRLVGMDPSNSHFRLAASCAYKCLGSVQYGFGDLTAARESFERELEINQELEQASPADTRYASKVARTLVVLANIDYRQGLTCKARDKTNRAVQIVEALVRRAPQAPHFLHQYGHLLITCAPDECRDPVRALPAAMKAVEMTHGENVAYLQTLAAVYSALGDHHLAAQTQQRALERMPAAGSSYSDSCESTLAKYQEDLAESSQSHP